MPHSAAAKAPCLGKGEGGLWRRVIAGQSPACIAGWGTSAIALVIALFLAVFVLPWPLGIVAILVGIAIELGEAAFWIRVSRRLRPRVGAEALVDAEGVALTDCRPSGRVRVRGESWRARCREGVDAGEPVVVLAVSDLTLEVRPK